MLRLGLGLELGLGLGLELGLGLGLDLGLELRLDSKGIKTPSAKSRRADRSLENIPR